MNPLTLRGVDRETERRMRELARVEGISLNKAALRLMKRGVETTGATVATPSPGRIGNALDRFIGTLGAKEARSLLAAEKAFEVIDERFWK